MRALLLAACAGFGTGAFPVAALAGVSEAVLVDELDELQKRVAQVPVLRGKFVQEKQIEGFRNPLKSSGQFLIARQRGVLWQTLAPFPAEVVLTRDRILTHQADGRSRVELDAREQPALQSVNALMFALMSGDVQALARSFALEPTLLPDGSWQLELVPTDQALAQVFEQLVLEGGRHVRSVEIHEASGDRTRLGFSDFSEEPAELSAEEAGRFD